MNSILAPLTYIIATAVGGSIALGQIETNRLIVPLLISDGTHTARDTFGCDMNYSYCIDPSVDSTLIEVELPPIPGLSVFDARFVDHRVGGECLGAGLRLHIQNFDLDTFRLRITPSDLGYPITISWSKESYGFAYWQNLRIGDAREDVSTYVNMLTESTYTITDPTEWTIDIVGLPGLDGIEDERSKYFHEFSLRPNYPNPFNSNTTISYRLDAHGEVEMSIFDLLGRRVSTILSGVFDPGPYTIVYDASELSGGVYILRLKTNTGVLSRKLIYIK